MYRNRALIFATYFIAVGWYIRKNEVDKRVAAKLTSIIDNQVRRTAATFAQTVSAEFARLET
jgi:hypothetical protein